MVRCYECGKPGNFWEVDPHDGTENITYNLCDEHAGKFGFCLGCGYFLAGAEFYECSRGYKYGYCQPCWDALNAELESNWDGTDDYCPY